MRQKFIQLLGCKSWNEILHTEVFSDVMSFLRPGTIMVAKIGMYYTCYCALFHQQVPIYQCHGTGSSLQNTSCNGCSICCWGCTSSTWPVDEWLSNSALQNDFHQNVFSIFCSPVFVFLGRIEYFSFLNYEPKIFLDWFPSLLTKLLIVWCNIKW